MRLARVAVVLLAAALAACASGSAGKRTGPQARGSTQDDPVRVTRLSEEIDFIQAQRCAGGSGRWKLGEQAVLSSPEERCSMDRINVRCDSSSEETSFYFLLCQ